MRNHRIQQNRKSYFGQQKPVRKLVSAVRRERPLRAKIVKPLSSAFISGGIGDVLAVESFLSDQDRQSLTTIFYATNKRIYLEELFRSVNTFPNLKYHLSAWEDFSNFWCFYSLEDYIKKCRDSKISVNSKIKLAKDLSILRVFEEIKAGSLKYNGCSFLKDTLTNISYLNLPQNYLVVLPYSTDKRIRKRDFNLDDWEQVLLVLKENDMKGVVINSEKEPIPDSNLLIDLSQKTTLTEAIEVLKASKGYFGIDSWMSVLAAKLFDCPNLQIKSNNEHCFNNSFFYYAPKTSFDFLVGQIKATNQKLILPQ